MSLRPFSKHSLFTSILIASFLLGSCKKTMVDLDSSTNLNAEASNVVIQCLVPQGNGGNWAATIAWMSETLLQRVYETRVGRNHATKFRIGCMMGGSSGSASTALYINLLTNKNLFPRANINGLYTTEEVEIAGDALRFLAISLDLDRFEKIVFFSNYFKAQVFSKINNTKIAVKIARSLNSKEPKWWGGEKADPNLMLVDYAKIALLANSLTLEDIYTDINTISKNSKDLETIENGNLKYLIDLPEYSSMEESKQENEEMTKAYSDLLKRQSDAIAKVAIQRINSKMSTKAQLTRYSRGVLKDSSTSVLKTIMERQIPEGFCTITMGEIHQKFESIDLDTPPSYEKLRPLVLCSEETIKKIISSKLYQNDIESGAPFASRFVFLVPKTIRSAITMSIREPGLMAELAEHANAGKNLDVYQYYDPTKDTDKEYKLKRIAEPNVASTKDFEQLYFAVAGGFPDRRMSAWVLNYYYSEILKQYDRTSSGYLSLFGKPDGTMTFALNSIGTFFSTNETMDGNKADWNNYQKSWCVQYANRINSGISHLETVVLNWDISKIPASQSDKSYLLVPKGINATRLQLASYRKHIDFSPGVVFDPNRDFLPVSADAQPCIN